MKNSKSLILFLQVLSTLFSTLAQILMFYMFWLTIRMWTLGFGFDFVSASVGFFLGYGLILYTLLVRGAKLKRFGTFSMSILTVISLLFISNKLYKMIIDLGSYANVVMNYLIVLLIIIFVIYFVARLLDFGISKLVSALFKTDDEQFELVKASTHYSKAGVELYESYIYVLKGFDLYNTSFTQIINTKKTRLNLVFLFINYGWHFKSVLG